MDKNASAPVTPQEQLRSFWNQRFAAAAYAYGTAPNDFLLQQAARLGRLPRGAPVLCLADGEGRNCVWLAGLGLAVTSVDLSDAGLAKARALAAQQGVSIDTVQADVTTFELGETRWAAIVCIFLHLPSQARRVLHRRCLAALQPGGLFIYEAYGPEQLALGTGGPRDLDMLASLPEVLQDVAGPPGLDIEHRHAGVRPVIEGSLHNGPGDVVQLVVRRRGA
ncbi:MAG: hypothetical protein RL375_2653 [Pseudomonadota bacterium]